MAWQQIYDPFNNMVISTLLAAVPVVVMLVSLGFLHIKAHIAAGLGLLAAVLTQPFDTVKTRMQARWGGGGGGVGAGGAGGAAVAPTFCLWMYVFILNALILKLCRRRARRPARPT